MHSFQPWSIRGTLIWSTDHFLHVSKKINPGGNSDEYGIRPIISHHSNHYWLSVMMLMIYSIYGLHQTSSISVWQSWFFNAYDRHICFALRYGKTRKKVQNSEMSAMTLLVSLVMKSWFSEVDLVVQVHNNIFEHWGKHSIGND